MKTVHYRRWHPDKSPVRIEFLPTVLQQVRSETQLDHDRGFLFGSRQQNDIRALAARRTPHIDDPYLRGTVLVGVYISRVRGEVFLTDADLAFMDQHQTGVALVVAGRRAGFFVREPDGSIQAVRSYEEFSVADAATTQAEPVAMVRTIRHPALGPPQAWRWAGAALGLLSVPAAALAYFSPLLPLPPIELQVHEQNGQLVISWDPRTLRDGGRLEIAGEAGHTVLQLPPGTASTTYATRSKEVRVHLSSATREGSVRWTANRARPKR